MALKIKLEDKSKTRNLVKPGQRLYLTSDRDALVAADDPRRRYLFCTENQTVPREEIERLLKATENLDAEEAKSAGNGGAKSAGKGEDKSQPKGEDKAAAKGGAKGSED